jgi:hypothetical protein
MRILAILTLAVVAIGLGACKHNEPAPSGTMPPAKGYHK